MNQKCMRVCLRLQLMDDWEYKVHLLNQLHQSSSLSKSYVLEKHTWSVAPTSRMKDLGGTLVERVQIIHVFDFEWVVRWLTLWLWGFDEIVLQNCQDEPHHHELHYLSVLVVANWEKWDSLQNSLNGLYFVSQMSHTNQIWIDILTWLFYNKRPTSWSNEKQWLIQESKKKKGGRDNY